MPSVATSADGTWRHRMPGSSDDTIGAELAEFAADDDAEKQVVPPQPSAGYIPESRICYSHSQSHGLSDTGNVPKGFQIDAKCIYNLHSNMPKVH